MNKELFTWNKASSLTPTPYFEEMIKSRPFDDKFLTYLSIRKWQRIVLRRLQIGFKGYIDEQGHFTCALCRQYFCAYECDECPIFWITKQDTCSGTPYTSDPSFLRALAELLFLYFVYFTVWVRIGIRR